MKSEPIKILLIEDEPLQVRLLQEFLKESRVQKFHLEHVSRLQDGLCWVKEQPCDVILLDLTLPDSCGLESLTSLIEQVPSLPIVVLTNTNDNALAIEAVRLGAQDYLIKNQITPELLTRALCYAIERKQAAEALYQANETLEMRVQERTTRLTKINQRLQQEIKHRQSIQDALAREKELAQVTLQSIGDAVITTNAQGKVESLNPIAETLTGWTAKSAKGHPLLQVLQLFEEETNQHATNPVTQVLATGHQTSCVSRSLLRSTDGTEHIVEHTAAPICLLDGRRQGAVLVIRDVTYTHQLVNQLSWQASHDSLTGLINRREFERHLKEAVITARNLDQQYTLCFFDLDQFKLINDTCGHAAGDELLRHLSALLKKRTRKTDVLARLGGDEFGLLLPDCSEAEGLKMVEQLLEMIRTFRFEWEEKVFAIGVSTGLVVIDNSTESAAEVLSTVDTAMYLAKEEGGHRIQVYRSDDWELAKRHGDMKWVSQINTALESNRFCLYAQMIAPIQSNSSSISHYELLLRMRGDHDQLILPSAFIPAAERYNLMKEIDQWVVRTLFSHLKVSTTLTKSMYAINLSGTTLNNDDFLTFVKEQLSLHQIKPSSICFELTETSAVANLDNAAKFIRQLKQLGCHFALDDFGSGMSSLGYLKTLPVDYLKIDGCFIQNIIEDPISAVMVEAIHRIAHVMGLETIAEYVVCDHTLSKLQELGIDYAQGYAIAEPCPLSIILDPISRPGTMKQ